MRVIGGLVVISLILGLLCLINNAATNALFSLFVASNYLSWGTPIFCRLVWGQERFYPGEFYTGRLSKPIAWIAVVYLLFGVVLSMFPTGGPNPSREFILLAQLSILGNLTNSRRSGGYELHSCNKWVRVGWVYGLLFLVCATLVCWPTHDSRR